MGGIEKEGAVTVSFANTLKVLGKDLQLGPRSPIFLWVLLLPLLILAAFCIVTYTPLILKQHWPEWAPGIGLGLLPVLGVYFVQAGGYTLTALAASIPPGLLVHNLLLLNEGERCLVSELVEGNSCAEPLKAGRRMTLPQVLGLARTLTLTALHQARAFGYRVAVLPSTPMAEALYRSIGFSTIAQFRLFASEEVYI